MFRHETFIQLICPNLARLERHRKRRNSRHMETHTGLYATLKIVTEQWIDPIKYVLAPSFAILGIWLGQRWDRVARSEERGAAERHALKEQASDVLGRAKLTIDAIHPGVYGLLGAQMKIELEKLRAEADGIRPALSILACAGRTLATI